MPPLDKSLSKRRLLVAGGDCCFLETVLRHGKNIKSLGLVAGTIPEIKERTMATVELAFSQLRVSVRTPFNTTGVPTVLRPVFPKRACTLLLEVLLCLISKSLSMSHNQGLSQCHDTLMVWNLGRRGYPRSDLKVGGNPWECKVHNFGWLPLTCFDIHSFCSANLTCCLLAAQALLNPKEPGPCSQFAMRS